MIRKNGLLLTGLAVGYFMVLLDSTIVTVALPAIRRELGGGLAGAGWVANAYTILFASLLMSMGGLSDRFGAKKVFLGGLAVFLIASGLSAAAPTLGALIFLRAMLGVGGAALLPTSLAIITHEYADPGQRARALGVWASVSGIALAAGPVIGGFLTETLGWRSIFLLNVPIAVASFVITFAFIKETPRRNEAGLDPLGQATGILSVGAATFGLMEGEQLGWGSPWILGSFGVALLMAALFGYVETRGKSPMLPLRMFRNRTLSAGMAAGFLINFGFTGVLFIMTLWLQDIRGYSALAAGVSFLPLTIPLIFVPSFTFRIANRFGVRLTIGIGFLLTAAGTFVLTVVPESRGLAAAEAALFMMGFGIPLVIPSLVSSVLSAAPHGTAGAASGALNSMRQLGATFGVAFLGTMAGGSLSFTAGFRIGLAVTGVLLALGSVLAFLYIGRRRTSDSRSPQPDQPAPTSG